MTRLNRKTYSERALMKSKIWSLSYSIVLCSQGSVIKKTDGVNAYMCFWCVKNLWRTGFKITASSTHLTPEEELGRWHRSLDRHQGTCQEFWLESKCQVPPVLFLPTFCFSSTNSVCVLVNQSYPTLCSLPGSFVRGISQARILEWVAIPLSRRSSRPRNWTCVSCFASGSFSIWASNLQQHQFRAALAPAH